MTFKGFPDARRIASRRDVTLPCQAVRLHDFKLIADRTLDVSIEGVLLPLRVPVLTGESILLSFEIPGMWIDVEATVARVVHGRRPGDDGLAVGVVFDQMASTAKAALAGFLHGRAAPLPRRGPLGRVRRGERAPQLADEVSRLGTRSPATPRATHPAVDGLGVLRAVVMAWQGLAVADGAVNGDT